MIVYPNAKINVGLNVINKRLDGYHNISSVFYPLYDLTDILEIQISNKFFFSTSGIISTVKNNLCEQTFKLLKNDYDLPNIHIHLHKRIPVGAGLGGGSSNAAFTLRVINELFDLQLSNLDFKKYAIQLGADCPFFIDNTPKYIQGIGDQMLDIDLDLSLYEIRIVDPKIHISTKKAYSNIFLTKQESNLLEYINKPIDSWKKNIINDFEKSIFNDYPELYKIKKDFYSQGALYSSMSGTGSVIYAIFKK